MKNSIEKLDFDTAYELYEFYYNAVIYANNIELKIHILNNNNELYQLLEYLEQNEHFERCMLINEIIKKFILDKKFKKPNSAIKDNNDTYYDYQFKTIFLSAVYFNCDYELNSRFLTIENEDYIDKLLDYYYLKNDYFKFTFIDDFRNHYLATKNSAMWVIKGYLK